MTMSHKEALEAAWVAFCSERMLVPRRDLEAAIRAYLDARGLVMVPKEPTPMIEVFYKNNRLAAAWSSMLAAAPDPFGGE